MMLHLGFRANCGSDRWTSWAAARMASRRCYVHEEIPAPRHHARGPRRCEGEGRSDDRASQGKGANRGEIALGSRAMDNQLTLGRVHVVEWLNAGDDDTGQKLFAELQPMGAASQPKVEVDFYRIDTTRELLGLLSAFTDQYRADK